MKDGLIVNEIVELLEEDPIEGDYIINVQDIAPPLSQELTDEDSEDEDSGGMLDNLSRNQLLSQTEAVLSHNVRIGTSDLNLSGFSKNRKRVWICGDLVDHVQKQDIFPKKQSRFSEYQNKTSV